MKSPLLPKPNTKSVVVGRHSRTIGHQKKGFSIRIFTAEEANKNYSLFLFLLAS